MKTIRNDIEGLKNTPKLTIKVVIKSRTITFLIVLFLSEITPQSGWEKIATIGPTASTTPISAGLIPLYLNSSGKNALMIETVQ